MKPTKTFKLKKTTKTRLASIVDPQQRSEWKRAMIDAQLCSEVVIKTPSRDKNAPRGASGYQVTNTSAVSAE